MRTVVNLAGEDRASKYEELVKDEMGVGVRGRLLQVCGVVGPEVFDSCTEEIRRNLDRFREEIWVRDEAVWNECSAQISVGELDEQERNEEMFWRKRMDWAMGQMYLYCEQSGGSVEEFGFR